MPSPSTIVTLKMDIEGAEFKVLRRMCDDGSMKRVATLVIEVHEWFVPLEEGGLDPRWRANASGTSPVWRELRARIRAVAPETEVIMWH